MSIFTQEEALKTAQFFATCDSMSEAITHARELADRLPGNSRRGGWKYYFQRFADTLERGELPHSIFAEGGNSKLPFVAFSTLPIVSCPGAGACAGIEKEGDAPELGEAHCYSLRAWRYPAAFLRQSQNLLLLRFRRRAIIDAFRALEEGITLRLYVDGDFDSVETALFWFNLLRQRADISAYGYSKSWRILASVADIVPANYALNLSSGGIDDGNADLKSELESTPFVRGEFVALPIVGKFARGFARYKDPNYHRAVREAARVAGVGKVFSCPGNCGDCLPAGHACGVVGETGEYIVPITIAIGVH
jgi:hypothetical protein